MPPPSVRQQAPDAWLCQVVDAVGLHLECLEFVTIEMRRIVAAHEGLVSDLNSCLIGPYIALHRALVPRAHDDRNAPHSGGARGAGNRDRALIQL